MKPFNQDAEEQKDKEEKEDGELASEEAALVGGGLLFT